MSWRRGLWRASERRKELGRKVCIQCNSYSTTSSSSSSSPSSCDLTIRQVVEAMDGGGLSAETVVRDSLARIEERAELRAFISLRDRDVVVEEAKSSDLRCHGERRPLEGIPVAVKDNFQECGTQTTNASKILGNYRSSYDSDMVRGLKEAGAVTMGKTNMDEFAMGSMSRWSSYGPVVNPVQCSEGVLRSPGGSSGGSAAAVAAGMVFAALGSDTGGSVRQPASHCGVVGFKPTYGTLSRFGMTAFASSLDCPGIFARDVQDTILIYETLLRHCHIRSNKTAHTNDSTLHYPHNHLADTITHLGRLSQCREESLGCLDGVAVGIPEEYLVAEIQPEVEELWKAGAQLLASAGAKVIPVSLPHTSYALPVYYALSSAEASSNLARYDGMRYGERVTSESAGDGYQSTVEKSRTVGIGFEAQRRILLGTFCLSQSSYDQYHKKAMQVRRLIWNDFEAVFRKVDILLTPSCQTTAPPLSDTSLPDFQIRPSAESVIEEYMNDVMLMPASLAGVPAMSVPAGRDRKGLPIGLQLISSWHRESQMFEAAIHLAKLDAVPS